MRKAGVMTVGLILAACSGQPPKADADDLDDFTPPTVEVRGDVVPRQQARFARLDTNTDGLLTPNESPKRRPERIARLDRDGDSRVSRSELVEGMLKRFDALDTDRDGQVTPAERRAGGE